MQDERLIVYESDASKCSLFMMVCPMNSNSAARQFCDKEVRRPYGFSGLMPLLTQEESAHHPIAVGTIDDVRRALRLSGICYAP